MTMTSERTAFEAAYRKTFPHTCGIRPDMLELEPEGEDSYKHPQVYTAWQLWKAARAETSKDTERLDFIEANENTQLRCYKRHWSFRAFTNYPHEVFADLRDAIDDAMKGTP